MIEAGGRLQFAAAPIAGDRFIERSIKRDGLTHRGSRIHFFSLCKRGQADQEQETPTMSQPTDVHDFAP